MVLRKLGFIALIGMFLVVALGGVVCAQQKEPVEIRFRYYAWPAHSQTAKKYVETFNAQHMPNIKLVWDGFAGTTDDERAKHMTMLMAQSGDVDIMICDSPWITEFASKGWLLPLDQFMEDKEAFQKPFYAFSNAIGSYQGVQYGVARSVDNSFLYYRKDIFEEKGLEPPKTLDELVEVVQKVNAPPDVYGLLFQGAQYEGLICGWIELFHNYGGTIFGESRANPAGGEVGQRKSQLYSDAAVKATQFLYDLIYSYKVSPPGTVTYTEGEVRKFFEAGGAAMAREWHDMAAEFNNPEVSEVAGNVGVVQLPAGPSGSRTCLGGWVFAINKFTKHPEEAWTALKFLTSVDSLKMAFLTDGIPPGRPDVFSEPEIEAHPVWGTVAPTLIKAVDTGIPRPLSPIWPQQSDAITRAIHKVFVKEMTADEAMKWAHEEVQKIEDAYTE